MRWLAGMLLVLAGTALARGRHPNRGPWTEEDEGVTVQTMDGSITFTPLCNWTSPWLGAGGEPLLFYYYRGGRSLLFTRRGCEVFVRTDGKPKALAGIVADSDEGLQKLTAALARGTENLMVWVPAAMVAALPQPPAGCEPAVHVYDGVAPEPEALKKIRWARQLFLHRCSDLTDIEPLGEFRHLTDLWLAGCPKLTSLEPLRRIGNLRTLMLWSLPALEDLSPLAGHKHMTHLQIIGCKSIRDIAPVANMRQLVALRVSYADKLSDLSPIAGLTKLRVLFLDYCPKISDLGPLAGLKSLRYVVLAESPNVRDLAPLANAAELEFLSVAGRSIPSLAPLADKVKLRRLYLNSCSSIRDLSPIAKLPKLEKLALEGCDGITDLSPLRELIRRGLDVQVYGKLEQQLQALRREARTGPKLKPRRGPTPPEEPLF